MPPDTPTRTRRNLFTDYDDTLVCSCAASFAIAGTDTSHPRHTVYPAMGELVRQLIAGTPTTTHRRARTSSHTLRKRASSSATPPSSTVYISTARPNLPGLRKDPRTIQRTLRLPHPPILLYGDPRVGAQWVASRLWDSTQPKTRRASAARTFRQRVKRQLGHTKCLSWLRVNGADAPSVFLGDSGQGDVYAALEILRHVLPRLRRHTAATARAQQSRRTSVPPLFRAYIHLLDPPTDRRTKQLLHAYRVSPAVRRHICVYRTTREAAHDAHRHGLITAAGLKRVQHAYRAEVRTTPCVFQATDTNTQQRHWWTFVPQPTKDVLGHLYAGQRAPTASDATQPPPQSAKLSKTVPRYPFRPPSRHTLSYATFARTGQLRYVQDGGETRGKLCDIAPTLNRVVLGECLRAL